MPKSVTSSTVVSSALVAVGLALALAAAAPCRAETAAAIRQLQAFPAAGLSPLLPNRPLAAWLNHRVGGGGFAAGELTGCGGHAGGDALCVKAWARLKDGSVAGMLVEVGSRARPWSGRPRIRNLFARAGSAARDFTTVRAWLAQIDLMREMGRGRRP